VRLQPARTPGPRRGARHRGAAVAVPCRPDAPSRSTLLQDAGWTTYAHDPARTSASSGCLFAPLHASWSFSPRWVKGTPSHATRAVVAGDAVYVSGGIGPTPTIWRLGVGTGDIRWTYITMADATRDGWPTLAGPKVMLVDDGVYSIDAGPERATEASSTPGASR